MSDTYIERIDVHGAIIWLPPLPADKAAKLAGIIREKVDGAADLRTAAHELQVWGGSLVWHPGETPERDTYTLAAQSGTWLAAQIAPEPSGLRMTADALKAWRKRLGLTQTEAAAELGISRSQVARYELGEHEIPRTVELATEAITARKAPLATGR